MRGPKKRETKRWHVTLPLGANEGDRGKSIVTEMEACFVKANILLPVTVERAESGIVVHITVEAGGESQAIQKAIYWTRKASEQSRYLKWTGKGTENAEAVLHDS